MRLDLWLVQNKRAASRTQAQEFIKNGHVFLLSQSNKLQLLKPNYDVDESKADFIHVEQNEFQKYVSRGGLKLEMALSHLKMPVRGKKVLDVGQSTGGFTDCLLQLGADRVVGIDVGRDQIHDLLKEHSDVKYFESLHVNELATRSEFLAEVPSQGFDLIVADVSFISLTKVMLLLKPYLKTNGDFLFLVKPQFELTSNALDKNGIVKDEKTYVLVQNNVTAEAVRVFGQVIDYFKSGLQGKDGNQEFFIYGKKQL